MKKKIGLFISVMLVMIVLAGCGQKKLEPVAVNEATDKCDICSMQVKDDAYAVQLTTKDSKTFKFDDLGCMNEWKAKNGTANVTAEFVRDYNSKEWVNYEQATYVFDPSFKSPMAYGIYSFKTKEDAQKFVDSQKKGKLMTAKDLTAHTWERNKSAMDKGMGKMNMNEHEQKAHSQTGM